MYKSVAEARKKAEGAILNLWPYEVRYPNYIEEGFDENIVGGLFDNLGFSKAPSKAIHGTRPLPKVGQTAAFSANMARGRSQENIAPMSSNRSNVAQTSKVGDNSDGHKTFTMAKSKSPLLSNSNMQSSTSASTTTIAQAKPAGPTDKEKTLQLKMEALRKSREERAQTAAAKTV